MKKFVSDCWGSDYVKNSPSKTFFFSLFIIWIFKITKVLHLTIFDFSLIILIIQKAMPEPDPYTYLQVEEQLCLPFFIS